MWHVQLGGNSRTKCMWVLWRGAPAADTVHHCSPESWPVRGQSSQSGAVDKVLRKLPVHRKSLLVSTPCLLWLAHHPIKHLGLAGSGDPPWAKQHNLLFLVLRHLKWTPHFTSVEAGNSRCVGASNPLHTSQKLPKMLSLLFPPIGFAP